MQKLIKSLLDKRGLLSTITILGTLALLLMPSSGSSKAMIFPHFDKIAHIAVFGACAFFLYIDLRLGFKPSKKALKQQIIIILLGILIGYVVEVIQDQFLGREYSLQDVFADFLGLIFGLYCSKVLFKPLVRFFKLN